jgi:ribonuclease BN (tRNA processing enzyme)
MRVTVLGCSGGIGGERHTTSLLVDDDILVDAGTGVTRLALEDLAKIDHVFITHSHLDHHLALPLLLDSVGAMRDRPVTAHALPEVAEILKGDIFNWRIWPDFTQVPHGRPFLRWSPVHLGETEALGSRRITPLPAQHVVPACGYWLDSGAASLAFSGDTGPCDAFWDAVNAIGNLRHLIVECAFPQDERNIAEVSKHHSPATLIDALARYRGSAEVYITHPKPGREAAILEEARARAGGRDLQLLHEGQVFGL